MVDYAIDIRKQLYPDQEIPEVRLNFIVLEGTELDHNYFNNIINPIN